MINSCIQKNNTYKLLNILFISILLIISNISFLDIFNKENISYAETISSKNNINNACLNQNVGINSALEIEAAIFNSLSNMFPIEIGKGSGVCACNMGPIERVGITLSFWTYVGAIEVTSIENCSPTLGLDLSFIQNSFKKVINDTSNNLIDSLSSFNEISDIFSSLGLKNVSKNSNTSLKNIGASSSNGSNEEKHSFQVHFIPPSIIINEIMRDVLASCFVAKKDTTLSFSEFSPIYQNDFLSSIFNPETILTANPVATSSCMAESISLQAKKNIDSLYWCAGTWGNIFPISQNVGSGDRLSAQALIGTRKLYSMFKKAELLDMAGLHMTQGICQPTYSPILPKSEINLVPIYPKERLRKFPIGYSSKIFGAGLNSLKSPALQVYAVYQKTDCCLF